MYIEDHMDFLIKSISDLTKVINIQNEYLNEHRYLGKESACSMINSADELLTAAEIAKLLKCNVNSVYGLMKAGLLPYLILGSRKVRRNTFEKFLQDYEGWDLTDPYNPKPIN